VFNVDVIPAVTAGTQEQRADAGNKILSDMKDWTLDNGQMDNGHCLLNLQVLRGAQREDTRLE